MIWGSPRSEYLDTHVDTQFFEEKDDLFILIHATNLGQRPHAKGANLSVNLLNVSEKSATSFSG